MKIYTKTGDKGTSALYNGERRAKDDAIFETLGTMDELSSMIGLASEFSRDVDEDCIVLPQLASVQCAIQDINSNVATPRTSSAEFKVSKTAFDQDGTRTTELEQWIDHFDQQLPPLKNFILPSGGKAASTLHVCRGMARRAERRLVPLVREGSVDESCGMYMNRLSDYLFMAARYMSQLEGKEETIYRKMT
ncbi:hypothetical protein MP228_005613 [Amoeboaphelidium protococcarum]|nr:hypothetical protein MP228_005613 [Amoeboaphelidium protococcarum]